MTDKELVILYKTALEHISNNSTDITDPCMSPENSQGNGDDQFYDGVRQGEYYAAEIAREALEKGSK